MAIGLRKQSAAEVRTPPPTRVTFFVDLSGNPQLKDSTGAVTPAVSIDGSPIGFLEQVSDPTPVANTIFVYAKDDGGVPKLYQMDDAGIVSPLGSGGNTIRWKEDTPGNPYVAGDTVVAAFGDIIMVNVVDPDSVTIELPEITQASATRLVQVRNLADKKGPPGVMVFEPDAGDAIETYATGAAMQIGDSEVVHLGLESDGVGRWNHVLFGGGAALWSAPP